MYCVVELVQAMASIGLAPALIDVYPITPVAAGWSAVVMEHVEVRDVDLESLGDKTEVETAVAALHEAGFLHGDLRDPNVKVTSWSAVLWAGTPVTCAVAYISYWESSIVWRMSCPVLCAHNPTHRV